MVSSYNVSKVFVRHIQILVPQSDTGGPFGVTTNVISLMNLRAAYYFEGIDLVEGSS